MVRKLLSHGQECCIIECAESCWGRAESWSGRNESWWERCLVMVRSCWVIARNSLVIVMKDWVMVKHWVMVRKYSVVPRTCYWHSLGHYGKTTGWYTHHFHPHLWMVEFPYFPGIQFSSVAQSCPTLCNPMNRSMPGLPVHHQLPEFTQTHVHRVSDAIHPSHPLSSPSPPAPNPSQHQGLFQWVHSLQL